LKVIASLKNIYGLSEQDVFEFFEMLVPEYKSSKANSNGNFLSKKKSVLKEN